MAVIKRQERNWAVRFSYTDASGQKHEYFKGGFDEKRQAVKHETEIRRGIKAARRDLNKQKIQGLKTFEEFALTWAETTLRASTRPSGFDTAVGRLTNHLIPALGRLPLASIQKSDGEAFKLLLREEKKLAPKTVNHCLATGKKLLSDAVDEGLIDRNPWDRLKLVPAAEPDWDWLRPDELAPFLNAVEKDHPRWILEMLLASRSGLRTCEVAGLMVEDCDLERGDIRIRRDVVRGQVQRCKSLMSHGRLVAPSDLLAELRRRSKHALLRPVQRFTVDRREHAGHLFSVNKHGEPHQYLPETIERAVTAACKAAGLRRITFYDLRHSYASHLRLRGVPLEDIRDLLGHSSLQMTLRYAHISAERFEAAARALEAR